MDFVNKLTGSGNNSENRTGENTSEQQSGSSSGGGGFMGKMNNMAGGGAQGEKDEDFLDKGLLKPMHCLLLFLHQY